MAAKRRYQIALREGKSHTGPGGRRWTYGTPVVMVEGDEHLGHYLNDPRFAHQELEPGEATAPVPTPKAARPRSQARAAVQEREDEERQEREDDHDATLHGDELDEGAGGKKAPEPPRYSEKVVRLARTAIDVKKTSRGTLEQVAFEIGAVGPNEEAPGEAQNKDELLTWVVKRQTQIVADLGG